MYIIENKILYSRIDNNVVRVKIVIVIVCLIRQKMTSYFSRITVM